MPMDHPLARRTALLLFAAVVLSWGMNWAVTKVIVQSVFPFGRPRSARRSVLWYFWSCSSRAASSSFRAAAICR